MTLGSVSWSLFHPYAMQAAFVGNAAEYVSRGSICAGPVSSDPASAEQTHRCHGGNFSAVHVKSATSALPASGMRTTFVLAREELTIKSPALPCDSLFCMHKTCMRVHTRRSYASRIQPCTGASAKHAQTSMPATIGVCVPRMHAGQNVAAGPPISKVCRQQHLMAHVYLMRTDCV